MQMQGCHRKRLEYDNIISMYLQGIHEAVLLMVNTRMREDLTVASPSAVNRCSPRSARSRSDPGAPLLGAGLCIKYSIFTSHKQVEVRCPGTHLRAVSKVQTASCCNA